MTLYWLLLTLYWLLLTLYWLLLTLYWLPKSVWDIQTQLEQIGTTKPKCGGGLDWMDGWMDPGTDWLLGHRLAVLTIWGNMLSNSIEKLYKCNQYEFATSEATNLIAHKESWHLPHTKIHTGEKNVKCNICDFMSVYKELRAFCRYTDFIFLMHMDAHWCSLVIIYADWFQFMLMVINPDLYWLLLIGDYW